MREMDVLEDLKAYYRLFSDAWRLLKKYSDIQMSEKERWQKLTDEIYSICQASGNATISRKLLVGVVLDEIETISRKEAIAGREKIST